MTRVKNFNVEELSGEEEYDIEITFKFGKGLLPVVIALPRPVAIMLQADLRRVLGLEK